MSFIYIASPYSHPDDNVKQARYEMIRSYVADCLVKGEIVYSPINDNHPVAKYHGMPTHWEFWARLDKAFINASSKVRVYQMEGWDKSVGVKAEVEYAKSLGKEVEYVSI
jgi:hypothetical protein